jgi:hypothetical protein
MSLFTLPAAFGIFISHHLSTSRSQDTTAMPVVNMFIESASADACTDICSDSCSGSDGSAGASAGSCDGSL